MTEELLHAENEIQALGQCTDDISVPVVIINEPENSGDPEMQVVSQIVHLPDGEPQTLEEQHIPEDPTESDMTPISEQPPDVPPTDIPQPFHSCSSLSLLVKSLKDGNAILSGIVSELRSINEVITNG